MADWNTLYTVSLIVLSVLILCCVLRAILGPRVADRLLAVNMITTLVIIAVCILSLYLQESYLADVALLFSLLGCLGTVVLTRLLSARLKEKAEKEKKGVGA